MRRLLIALMMLLQFSCGAALQALQAASQGAQWLGTAIDVAEGGAERYFNRHPSLEREQDVRAAILRARLAKQALDGALAAADAADAGDVAAARTAALAAFSAMRQLLDEMGVLTATSPMGGSETDAPAPEPFELPTAKDIAARL